MMDFPVSPRTAVPAPTTIEMQKPIESAAEKTVLPAPLSVDEARIAAKTAREPREKNAIIRALLSNPPASTAALNLATQIAAQAQQALAGYTSARPSIDTTDPNKPA